MKKPKLGIEIQTSIISRPCGNSLHVYGKQVPPSLLSATSGTCFPN